MNRFLGLLTFCVFGIGGCHAQIVGTWAKYKTEAHNHLYYPAEEWQNDTLIFLSTTFERRLAMPKPDYEVSLKVIKGRYQLSKKNITFSSNDNLSHVKETYRYRLNEFGELVIGIWITPLDKGGNRDYRRDRVRVWTYYKKVK